MRSYTREERRIRRQVGTGLLAGAVICLGPAVLCGLMEWVAAALESGCIA